MNFDSTSSSPENHNPNPTDAVDVSDTSASLPVKQDQQEITSQHQWIREFRNLISQLVDCDDDHAREIVMAIDWLKSVTAELVQQRDAELAQRITVHGDLTMGDVRYYVGPVKTTKCTDTKGALEALMEATGGDWEKVVSCLASQPIKHGAASKLLPAEVYEKLFVVESKQEIKEGKPTAVEKLQKIDTRFIK
jgi:hypothetical protein